MRQDMAKHSLAVLAFSFTAALSVHATSADLTEVGAYYFMTPKLSRDGALSCASCHVPELAWQDGYERALSRHVLLSRNTPSLYNVLRHKVYFWDGRAASLEEQVAGPLFSRPELNSTDQLLIEATVACPDASSLWNRSGMPIRAFVQSALAAFLRTIPRKQTRFEQFIKGEDTLSSDELEGWRLFTSVFDCVACHKLPNLTDDSFHDIGLPRRKVVFQAKVTNRDQMPVQVVLGYDYGRLNVSDRPSDAHAFRTPSLFHVARTSPYMHDGMFRSLEEVLDFYSRRRVALGQPQMSELQKRALLALLSAFSDAGPAALEKSACLTQTKDQP